MRTRIVHIILMLQLVILSMQAQLLYEIGGQSSRYKSYILATHKLVDQTFIDTIPNVFHCFEKCDKVLCEFAMQDYEALQALRQAAILPDSIRLKNFYSDAEYIDIDETLKINLGMGMQELGRMKPSYLTEMLRNELLKRWLGYDEKRSMETFFESIASERGMPIFGLDNIGETMYMLFDREPFHWQCEELRKIIDYPERETRLERDILQMYRNGLLNDISYAISGPDNKSTLSYSDYQVYCQRNQQWVKRLIPYLKEGKCFITLNCIYLGGEKGLLEQLRAAGYKVKAVNKRRKYSF